LAGQSADQLHSVEDCAGLLARVDQALTGRPDCGETTGVVAIVDSGRIYGASVGDSAAWFFFSTGGRSELTRGQARKPLLGSGSLGTPRSFNWELEEGTLVVASDGLWNYTSLEAVQSRVRSRGTADLAVRLAELVRLESGDFPDDVAILTCRIDGA
jgi:serine/threonine protein phosphatase PrpC